jgi:hypothetical protein
VLQSPAIGTSDPQEAIVAAKKKTSKSKTKRRVTVKNLSPRGEDPKGASAHGAWIEVSSKKRS